MTCRIVTIGDLTADLIMPVQLPVEPGTSQQMPWHSVEPGGAGNFLIAGQRLGAPDSIQMVALGALGDDLYGWHVLDLLRKEGINVEGVAVMPGTTTTVVGVLFQPDAAKFAYAWVGGVGAIIEVRDDVKRLIDSGDALFMQGITLCEPHLRPLVDYALASGRPIWFDVGPATRDVSEPDRALIRQKAHALLTTEEELPLIAEGRSGPDACQFLLAAGARMVVVKRGGAGCRVVTLDETFDIPAFSVPVRDLIGAGDSFNAAFIYATLRGISPRDAALLANATGGAKVMNLGTGRGMPTRDEIMSVLRSGGVTLDF